MGFFFHKCNNNNALNKSCKGSKIKGWLSGRVLDSRQRSKNINPSLVLVQPRKTRPFITERLLLMGLKELNQTNKQKVVIICQLAVIDWL